LRSNYIQAAAGFSTDAFDMFMLQGGYYWHYREIGFSGAYRANMFSAGRTALGISLEAGFVGRVPYGAVSATLMFKLK